MLYFSRWKIYLILATCIAGFILMLPNFLGRDTLAALPSWYANTRVSLGLDLRGGSHLLLEVDMATVIRDRVEGLIDGARQQLRTANIGYTALNAGERAVTVQLRDPAQAEEAVKALRQLASPVGRTALGGGQPDLDVTVNGSTVTVALSEVALRGRVGVGQEAVLDVLLHIVQFDDVLRCRRTVGSIELLDDPGHALHVRSRRQVMSAEEPDPSNGLVLIAHHLTSLVLPGICNATRACRPADRRYQVSFYTRRASCVRPCRTPSDDVRCRPLKRADRFVRGLSQARW